MDGDKIQTVQGTDVVIHKTNGNSANLVRLKNYLNYFYIFSLQRHLSWFFPKYIHWFALLLFFLLLLIISICARLNIHEKFLVYFKYHTVLIERLVLCVYEEYRYASLWPEPRYYHSIIN